MPRSHRWRAAADSAARPTGELRSGQVVLDVGCGPGTITADPAAPVAPGRVTGVDTGGTSLAAVHGQASTGQLAPIAAAWRAWGEESDAWFMVPHGEVLRGA